MNSSLSPKNTLLLARCRSALYRSSSIYMEICTDFGASHWRQHRKQRKVVKKIEHYNVDMSSILSIAAQNSTAITYVSFAIEERDCF
ncbi:unnamed protein product [Camellia sinensis]